MKDQNTIFELKGVSKDLHEMLTYIYNNDQMQPFGHLSCFEELINKHVEKIVHLNIELFEKGIEVFGNISNFNKWLNNDTYTPDTKFISCLSTELGIKYVSDQLDRIAHGYSL